MIRRIFAIVTLGAINGDAGASAFEGRASPPVTKRPSHRCITRIRTAFRDGWPRLGTDDPTAYLSQAVDSVDLQYRIRKWNEVERHDHLPIR